MGWFAPKRVQWWRQLWKENCVYKQVFQNVCVVIEEPVNSQDEPLFTLLVQYIILKISSAKWMETVDFWKKTFEMYGLEYILFYFFTSTSKWNLLRQSMLKPTLIGSTQCSWIWRTRHGLTCQCMRGHWALHALINSSFVWCNYFKRVRVYLVLYQLNGKLINFFFKKRPQLLPTNSGRKPAFLPQFRSKGQ